MEACTRLFRDQIMAASNLPPVTDVRSSYNRYLTNLESLRLRTSKGETEFCLTLLATPLVNREATVLQWIQDVELNKSFAEIAQETDFERQELLR